MSTPVNHFKLGLFTLLAIGAGAATAVAMGARAGQKETVSYHTYFNESVQGLNVGAPVTFRGVLIGTVSRIEIAPDHRQVDVTEELDVSDIRRLGLTEEQASGFKGKARFDIPPDLRAQLGSQGITGVKFVLIDFFDPASNPSPELGFEPAHNYIPAAASLFKNLEDSIVKAVDKFPELAESITSITNRVDLILGDIQEKEVPARAAATLDEAVGALKDLRTVLGHVDKADMPSKASKALTNLDAAISKLHNVLDRVDGDKGLIASAHRATDAFGNAGDSANGAMHDLDDTLRDVGEAAQSIRELAKALDRDPDMLLKGKSKKGDK